MMLEKAADRVVYGKDTTWGMDMEHFDWGPGVGLYGIWKAWQATGREAYLQYLTGWADRHGKEAAELRTINSTAPCLTIWELYRLTGNEAYRKICLEAAEYLVKEAPLTVDGGLEHTVTEHVPGMKEQMWADTLFMACIFLAKAGRDENKKEYTEFASGQLVLHYQYLWDEEKGLFYHAWNGSLRNHMSAVHWGRANAWILLSTLEILRELPEFEGRDSVIAVMKKHMKALCGLQRKNGMFGTVLDDASSYDEISASAGIACGLKLAAELGFAGPEEEKAAALALTALPSYIGAEGDVACVSTGTPVMADAQAYKAIPYEVTLYGQALMIMALARMEDPKAAERQDK